MDFVLCEVRTEDVCVCVCNLHYTSVLKQLRMPQRLSLEFSYFTAIRLSVVHYVSGCSCEVSSITSLRGFPRRWSRFSVGNQVAPHAVFPAWTSKFLPKAVHCGVIKVSLQCSSPNTRTFSFFPLLHTQTLHFPIKSPSALPCLPFSLTGNQNVHNLRAVRGIKLFVPPPWQMWAGRAQSV